ncbi:MAG: hypothetical protein HY894_05060 [Deltaproteobacteria bacterium]|nr:hypothetical protein [Deltaproteobacteria bacterium]
MEKHRVIKKGNDFPLLLACVILLLNGVASFAYAAWDGGANSPSLWALFATNFVFFLGLTQTGMVFSAIMRLAKSEWARYFTRLGEILTLAYAPFAFIFFIIIYFGGTGHLFYWAKPVAEAHGEGHRALSPWLGKDLFLWRNIILMALYYVMSYIYFRAARDEERYEHGSVPDGFQYKINFMAALVLAFYVLINTNISWDFGMMIIKHWESSIHPPYWWVGNVYGGAAFLFLMSLYFVYNRGGRQVSRWHLNAYGMFLIGLTLLWTYMYWSQHVVMWYGDLPELTRPLFKQRTGSYAPLFIVMMFLLLIIPFLSLLFKKVKSCVGSLIVLTVLICLGVWLNRYLMILTVFEDAPTSLATWTNLSLFLAGLGSAVLPVMAFVRLFPNVPVTTEPEAEENSGH